MAARSHDLIRAKSRKQPKDIEHRQVDAVGSKLAIAGEPRLTNEGESPGKRTFKVHLALPGQLPEPRITGGGVARIQGAIAIRVLRSRAGVAALGIVLADDYRLVGQLRYRGDPGEGLIGGLELVGDAHADVAIHDRRL